MSEHFQDEPNARKGVADQLKHTLSFATDELLQAAEAPQARAVLGRAFRVLDAVSGLSLETAPRETLHQLWKHLSAIANLLSQLRQLAEQHHRFVANLGAPGTDVLQDLSTRSHELLVTAGPLLAYRGLEESHAKESSVLLEDIRRAHSSAEEGARRVEELVEAARSVLASSGLGAHAQHFILEAEADQRSARNWLTTTAVIGAVMVVGLVSATVWYLTRGSLNLTAEYAVQLGY